MTLQYKDIHDLCGAYLVDLIKAYAVTEIVGLPAAQDFLPTEVRQGTLQDDPEQKRIYILVSPGDPADTSESPAWKDTIAREEDGWVTTSYEIGGGERWWRRFTITIGLFFTQTRESRDEARRIATWVMGRVQKAVQDHQAVDLTDDFGEHAYLLLADMALSQERGGPPDEFIWKERIHVRFLAEKP
jgi:hypothetical protein